MEVRDREETLGLFLEPLAAFGGQAARTMPVPTGAWRPMPMRAVGTSKKIGASAGVPQTARRQSTRSLCLPNLSRGSRAVRKARRMAPNVKHWWVETVLPSTTGQNESISVRSLWGEIGWS